MGNSNYIGDELSIFKYAINWKKYWYDSVKQYIKGDLLEVGAGMGINTNLILQNNTDIKSIMAIEPDKSLSDQILDNIEGDTSKVTVFNGFLADIGSDKMFDTIIYIDVIEHIEHDNEELKIAQLHLKKGGHLVILVPAYNYLYSPFDKAIGHYRRYNKKMLVKAIPNDLVRQKLFYLDSLGACASLVNKLVLKQSYPTKNQILKWDRLLVPTSKFLDNVVFNSFGKSLIGIWKK